MSGRMIDLLAALLIFLAIVKLLVLSIRTPAWLHVAKLLYANRTGTTIVFYALAGLVLYALLQSGLTIVQILAVSLFTSLLLIPGFAPYMGEVLRALEGQTFGRMMCEQWHYTLVWTGLLFWGAYELILR